MNILILEDNTLALKTIEQSIDKAKSKLPNQTYNIVKCYNIYQANEKIEQNIDLVITDLNMSKRGLRTDQYSATIDGFLTGWIWVENSFLQCDKHKNTKIIIFSEYTELLQKTYGNETTLNKQYGNGEKRIRLLSKLCYSKDCIINILSDYICAFNKGD